MSGRFYEKGGQGLATGLDPELVRLLLGIDEVGPGIGEPDHLRARPLRLQKVG